MAWDIKPVFQVRGYALQSVINAPYLPGDDEPQVTAYGLEEEVDYYAPAFRFEDEDDNPWITYRQMSETPLPENHLLDARLRKEKEDAINQINHVRNVLQQIKQEANHLLNN